MRCFEDGTVKCLYPNGNTADKPAKNKPRQQLPQAPHGFLPTPECRLPDGNWILTNLDGNRVVFGPRPQKEQLPSQLVSDTQSSSSLSWAAKVERNERSFATVGFRNGTPPPVMRMESKATIGVSSQLLPHFVSGKKARSQANNASLMQCCIVGTLRVRPTSKGADISPQNLHVDPQQSSQLSRPGTGGSPPSPLRPVPHNFLIPEKIPQVQVSKTVDPETGDQVFVREGVSNKILFRQKASA